MRTPLLAVNNLRCSYGSLKVITDLTLDLDAGDFAVIAAPNGAGKTTTLNALAGVLGRQGVVTVDGKALRAGTPEGALRAGIALVPENRQLFPALTVQENLLMGSYVWQSRRKGRRDYAMRLTRQEEEILQLFPILADRAQQQAGTLSGGQQQMLAISRALMGLPKVLLLDEPTLGLAPKIVESLRDALIKLQSDGLAVLLAEQNSRAFVGVANKFWRLAGGGLHVTDN